MPLIRLLPAAPGAAPLTSATTSVLRHLDAVLVTDLLLRAAPATAGARDAALLVEGQDGHRVSGAARGLLVTTTALVLVVTADRSQPEWVAELAAGDGAGRVVWCSSVDLADTVEAALAAGPTAAGPTELSRTLLTELLAYWDVHGLRSLHDTVVVAGRTAWPEYLRTGAVISEHGGGVRAGTTHVGFYVDGAISDVVAAVQGVHRGVRFTPAAADGHRDRGEHALAAVIDAALSGRTRVEGSTGEVLLLSAPDATGTVRLSVRVADDATTPGGRRTPWTLTRRYTHLERLRSGAAATSQL